MLERWHVYNPHKTLTFDVEAGLVVFAQVGSKWAIGLSWGIVKQHYTTVGYKIRKVAV